MMTAPAVGESMRLRHDALFYSRDEELVAGLVPFVRGGLAAGEAVVAAITRSNIEVLREALGADANAVEFIDRDEWYRRPAATVAGWQRLLGDALARGHRGVRIIGEVGFGAAARHPSWTRYEAALNRLFADAPAWIVCPYDSRALPEGVLADARRTHPTVVDPVRRGSDDYQVPERLLRAIGEPLPEAAGSLVVDMPLTAAAELATARTVISAALAGWPTDRLGEVLVAVNEIGTNGIRHGSGECRLRAWHTEEALVCEVTDHGPGPADLLAGYARPAGVLPEAGWGLWIVHQLCDAVAIDRHDGLTRVRFTAARTMA